MQACHAAVSNAVASGVLVKPKNCEICCLEKRLIAHHSDYSKPLLVAWVCESCHQKEHAKHGTSGLSAQIRINPIHCEKLLDIKSQLDKRGNELPFTVLVNLAVTYGIEEVRKSLLKD